MSTGEEPAGAIERLIGAAEPRGSRSLASLVDRLAARGLVTADGPDGGRPGGSPTHLPAEWGRLDLTGLDVGGITGDSRTAGSGSVFVAIPGAHTDGHAHLAAAAAAGAVAALVEHPVPGVAIPQLVVGRGSAALAVAAAWWYGDPSHDLGVVGITGTDGKTTTSFLALAALEAAGLSTGLVGTVDTQIGFLRSANAAHATTPDAPRLQALLRAMVAAGDRAAIIETTSHGLALDRVTEVAYDAAILTNVTHEHLDLHGTFEAYLAAKVSLFERLAVTPGNPRKVEPGWPKAAIVNLDDPSAPVFLAAAAAAGAGIVTYGLSRGADVRAAEIDAGSDGSRVVVDRHGARSRLAVRLAGEFNVRNALAVVALGDALGLDPGAVLAGIASVDRVPGRVERVDAGQPFDVVVDFAHSPASLSAILDLLRPIAEARDGRLIVVFGSAGERDIEKRPRMGRIAGERCDLVVLSDEDPRSEDPLAILDAIARGAEAAGLRRGRDLLLIPDRAAAIEAALASARAGDVVLLAGKGHERSIIGAGGERPWDEVAEARRALATLGFGAPAEPRR